VKSTFRGGVHPPEHKGLTENRPIELAAAPKQVAVLMSQHIGAICKPTVGKKDQVKTGDVIGESEAFVSARLHSPVDGIVKEIADRSHPVLGRVQAVIIDVDPESTGKKPADQSVFADISLEDISEESIIGAMGECGIVGMGGAGFPTKVKALPNPKMPKEVMIVNACECEPYITCDYRVMMEWTDQFIAGVRMMKNSSGCERCYIGIEDNKPKAIELLKSKVEKLNNIEVTVLKTKYPQGGERQLISAVLDKIIPTGQIPPMAGVVVCNVSTAAALAEAVINSTPLTHRVVTVSGAGVKKPSNFYLPIGISAAEVIEYAGGLTDDAVKIVMGGPMMGFAIGDLTTPTTKTTGSILALTPQEIGMAKFNKVETACIKCGRCLDVCPERLNPTRIAHAVKAEKMDVAEDNYIGACMECGSCSYICPANIELSGYIKTGKILIARKKKNMPG
jgi:Na+-translocating ferredoxin:NAD+ oxidoreductase subunit C